MQKYTYITDHPRNPISREKLMRALMRDAAHLDERALMKLYAFAHRQRRDKVK